MSHANDQFVHGEARMIINFLLRELSAQLSCVAELPNIIL